MDPPHRRIQPHGEKERQTNQDKNLARGHGNVGQRKSTSDSQCPDKTDEERRAPVKPTATSTKLVIGARAGLCRGIGVQIIKQLLRGHFHPDAFRIATPIITPVLRPLAEDLNIRGKPSYYCSQRRAGTPAGRQASPLIRTPRTVVGSDHALAREPRASASALAVYGRRGDAPRPF